MNVPYRVGDSIGRETWHALQTRAIFDYCKWDIQCQDHSVLADYPVFLSNCAASFLNEAAEALCAEAMNAEREIVARPQLASRLGLPAPVARALENLMENATHHDPIRVMRFDFHFTTEGWKISEVNSDVPGGFVEASGWNRLFQKEFEETDAPTDPVEDYVAAFCRIVPPPATIAFLHATAYSDDRQVMLYLARRFSERGYRSKLASALEYPGQKSSDGGASHADAFVRFFPVEWLPNLGRLHDWTRYFSGDIRPMSNPPTAIVLQSKRFPLIWNDLSTDLRTWKRFLPETFDPGEKTPTCPEEFVWKPALGRVGEDLGIEGVVPEKEFARIQKEARRHPDRWALQRRFSMVPMQTGQRVVYPMIGVFTIGGKAAGFYGRAASRPLIDQEAQDVPVLIERSQKRDAG